MDSRERQTLTWIIVAATVLLVVFFAVRANAQLPTECFGQIVNDGRATDGEDFLTGTENKDVIALGLGDDQYFAWFGGDTICGNGGADVIVGEGGPDDLSGGIGDDIVAGLSGHDTLQGGQGADTIKGGNGDDVIRAGGDTDRDDLYDGSGSDTIYGTAEDFWHQCADGSPDDTSNFTGNIIPDNDC